MNQVPNKNSWNSVPSAPLYQLLALQLALTEPMQDGIELSARAALASCNRELPAQDLHDSLKSENVSHESGPDSLESEFDSLESGSDSLESGSDSLESGSDSLESGSDSLESGSDSLESGSDSLESGSDSLESGSDSLESGSDSLESGSDSLESGSDSLECNGELLAHNLPAPPAKSRKMTALVGIVWGRSFSGNCLGKKF